MASSITGIIRKMRAVYADPVEYHLRVGEKTIDLNARIGDTLAMRFSGNIYCIACGRKTGKSFSQGYCFPCFRSLAECDMCIMKPETCHFHLGTCRDEQWAQGHCMQSHYVYIANSSGLKVGITRGSQVPVRWIDQGAAQALPVFKVINRYHSGLLENVIRTEVSDRTDWRKMLKGDAEPLDMEYEAGRILAACQGALDKLNEEHRELGWEKVAGEPLNIRYPVEQYPQKVTSLSFDKSPSIHGTLQGIKGQYLMLDSGVINIRKFGGYEMEVDGS